MRSREYNDFLEDLDDDELHDLLHESHDEALKRAIMREIAIRESGRTGAGRIAGAIILFIFVLAAAIVSVFLVA